MAAISFFEGTEKRIEMDFDGEGDLRLANRSRWEDVVRLSGTVILNTKVTSEFTSFLLSESSLIVYPRKVILKTCGRTVPMSAMNAMRDIGKEQGLDTEWSCYSRKNFLAPSQQPEEHQSQEAEIACCRQACGGVGDAYVLGPMTGEHWLIFDVVYKEVDCNFRGDFQVDMMMYDLPKDVQAVFHTDLKEGSREGSEKMTTDSGLGGVVASMGGEVDDWCFDKCGYSANIHAGEAYAMVHVTPQDECSYASFESNFCSSRKGIPQDKAVPAKLNELVKKVLEVFRPARLTMTLFIDAGAVPLLEGAPFGAADFAYRRRTSTSTTFESDYIAMIFNYEKRLDKRKSDN
mmetsp:Transcript_66601/g.119870  ORF Transcript_66601/g.119870 Transcript_66601/m.119870 type:complete len:347 (+) Transcript_66601:129-1169(+)